MKTFFSKTTTLIVAAYTTLVASQAELPWDGDFSGLTTASLEPTYMTHVLTDRADGAGGIDDYISLDGAVCTMSMDSNAVFSPNGAVGSSNIIRTDLVQTFTHPDAGTLMYEATLSKAEAFTDEHQYQVFFLEADDLGSKMFELSIHQEADGPVFRFRIRDAVVWEDAMELATDYHFQLYADAATSMISVYVGVGGDTPAEVASESADITMSPEVHWGLLIYDDSGASVSGSESLSFSNLGVSEGGATEDGAGEAEGGAEGTNEAEGGDEGTNEAEGGDEDGAEMASCQRLRK